MPIGLVDDDALAARKAHSRRSSNTATAGDGYADHADDRRGSDSQDKAYYGSSSSSANGNGNVNGYNGNGNGYNGYNGNGNGYGGTQDNGMYNSAGATAGAKGVAPDRAPEGPSVSASVGMYSGAAADDDDDSEEDSVDSRQYNHNHRAALK
jgi:hypothetical protein